MGDIETAQEVLLSGGVVALPTDTVFGLASLAKSQSGTQKIFELKDRPSSFVLPVLVADLGQAEQAVESSRLLTELSNEFWPGALTVIAKRLPEFEGDLGSNAETVGVRCPDHAFVRNLCSLVGHLAVTSANKHGEPECTTSDQVREVFGETVDFIVEGTADSQPPSTVVSILDGSLSVLRPGPIDEVSLNSVFEKLS